MTPFPLFRLPLVPLQDILKQFNPIQLLELSQCSKKSAKQIKLGGTQHFKISFDFASEMITIQVNGNPKFYYIGVHYQFSGLMHYFNIHGFRCFGDQYVQVSIVSNRMTTFWNDNLIGVETMGWHLLDLFGCSINWVNTGQVLSSDSFIRIMNLILDRQSEIGRLYINVPDLDGNELTKVLEKLKVIKSLTITSKTFTLDNLLAMNSKIIVLCESTFTNQDLDIYLSKWKAGGFPNLMFLSIESKRFDDDESIAGIRAPMRELYNPNIVSGCFDGHWFSVSGGINVQRDDGVTGTIKLVNDSFDLIVSDMEN